MDHCRTKWPETMKEMDSFEDLFVPIYRSLSRMKKKKDISCYNNETLAKVEPLYKPIDDFEFIITFVIMHNISLLQTLNPFWNQPFETSILP